MRERVFFPSILSPMQVQTPDTKLLEFGSSYNLNCNWIFQMVTSADLSWEENLTAHWMSNASRAGVILNPSFPSLRTTRAINIDHASLSFAANSLRSSSCASLSEDSLPGEEVSGFCSPCEEQLDAAKTPFPITWTRKQTMLRVKEGPDPCKALQNDLDCSRQDDVHEGCCNEPLTQKLEQVKTCLRWAMLVLLLSRRKKTLVNSQDGVVQLVCH